MTTEERFERIEHTTAGLAEERRKDREEYKALWRDTQRQLNELGARLVQMSAETQDADRQFRAADASLQARIRELAEADEKLGQRIAALTSAVGEILTQLKAQQ
jgi:prefoldin subunit 5